MRRLTCQVRHAAEHVRFAFWVEGCLSEVEPRNGGARMGCGLVGHLPYQILTVIALVIGPH